MESLARSFLFILFLSADVTYADTELADRFRNEYPKAAANLMAQVEHVSGVIRFRKEPVNGPARSYLGRFAADHGMWKAELLTEQDGRSLVICSGGEKEFLIIRNNQTEEYFIADLRREDTGGKRAEAYDELRQFYSSAYALEGLPLVEIMNSPGFQILDAQTVAVNGRDCIQIEYETSGSRLGDRGKVCVDPEANWVIRQASLALKPSAAISEVKKISVEYPQNSAAKIVPSSVSISGLGLLTTIEFSEWLFEPVPKEEFYIDHYGLSDANWEYETDVTDDSSTSGNSLSMWVTVTAVVVLFAAVVFKRFVKKHNT